MDYTWILELILAVLGVVVTAVLVPWLRARTTEAQQAQINALVGLAVQAAEQLYAGSGRGEEKKRYVLDWLSARGIKLDEDAVDAAIEAAVYKLKQGVV